MEATKKPKQYAWQREGRVPTVGENEQELADLRKQVEAIRAARAALAGNR